MVIFGENAILKVSKELVNYEKYRKRGMEVWRLKC